MIEVVGTPSNAPGPNASTEAQLRAWLKGIDGLLDIKWIPVAYFNEPKSRWEGRYALTVDWPSADKRWSMVQSGEVDPKLAHDIVGWICTDMSDPNSMPTSLEGVEDRVMEALGKMDNTRYPWKQRFESAAKKNMKVRQALKDEVADMTHDVASYYYNQAKGNPIVAVKENLK